jgi:hypothetical protein
MEPNIGNRKKQKQNICMATFVYNVAPCNLGAILFAFTLPFVRPGDKYFVTIR